MMKHIPNLITCCNLLCGVLGIIYCFDTFGWLPLDNYELGWLSPALFVWVASVFDFLDGLAARLLKVTSPIGKELDSLADAVTFGVLPSIFMYKQMEVYGGGWLPYVALLIAVFSVLRLAIFNIDLTQSDGFKGVPTPANTLFLTGLPFAAQVVPFEWGQLSLAIICVVSSFMLVARIDLFSLKFKRFVWKGNQVRFTFLMLSGLLIIGFKFAAVSLIVLLYVAISLLVLAAGKNKQSPA